MGAAGRRAGRGRPVPRGPQLGSRRPVGRRRVRHRLRRVPARRLGIRRRLLRHLAARGAGHGPAAAAPAGDLLGGRRARGHRPDHAQGHGHGRVHGNQRAGLREPVPRLHRGGRRAPGHRQRGRRRLRPPVLRLRPGRPVGHRRHRVLGVAGVAASRRPGTALGRVRPGPGRRRDGDVHAGRVPGVLPPARAGSRRPL